MMNEFSGRWVLRGGIRVPVADPPEPAKKRGPKPRPTVGDWDDKRLREAHRRYYHGDRDILTCEGERVYQARRKRAQRAGHMSPVDRVWAQKAAVKGSWIWNTKQNRMC